MELENELGETDFVRGRRIILTKEGMIFAETGGGDRLADGKDQSGGELFR